MCNKDTDPIVLNNLNFAYNEKHILKNINISFKKNKFYSILGPNGSGKTTLLKNILKALPTTDKTIYIDAFDINNYKNKDLAKKMSSVPQNTNLEFDFTSFDVVLMGRSPHLKRFERETNKDYEIVREAMEITNTWHLKDKYINQLSGGERQKVIIARALAQESSIILLDEPISNLDIQNQIEIMDTLKFLNRDVTIISVLHDLNLAAQYSDYILLLKNGEIFSKGTPEKVLSVNNLKYVYDVNTYIIKNPVTGKPHIIPISKNFLYNNLNINKVF
ncbi:ABC transporter ATP-binding protein [Clostridium cochlearium]|uniref:Iron complex transport system ATP-binding protein n=1 Tax=Clostridium cochlearium TaxID=1494 RepID=A0ABY0QIB1_CLOCO|nr:ABC transporter ATP-binding protein [Clostridium cochlearium]MCG4580728.1 ABC transporter ATP-binding protein [Clostridium cochlearium]NSJ90901.1 ABC transporter ATP-binding protein [Coprococcus sp. MSK.21.13]SDK85128.1 iron complex transport system ATP-binding protein [Clostridium cochlearium]